MALTFSDGGSFTELEHPRFTQRCQQQIKRKSKALRPKCVANRNKKTKPSRRGTKATREISNALRLA